MYKILTKKVAKDRLDSDAWVFVLAADNTEFVAATDAELKDKVKELLCSTPQNNIRVVTDVTYALDVILADGGTTT